MKPLILVLLLFSLFLFLTNCQSPSSSSPPIQSHGLVVPWYTTKVLEDMGLVDTYRSLHPDPLSQPGITWDVKDKTDEHRIDYIFYKGKKLSTL